MHLGVHWKLAATAVYLAFSSFTREEKQSLYISLSLHFDTLVPQAIKQVFGEFFFLLSFFSVDFEFFQAGYWFEMGKKKPKKQSLALWIGEVSSQPCKVVAVWDDKEKEV